MPSPDAGGVVDVLVPLLRRLLPSEAVALAEAAFDLLPATPATVRLILAVMARCGRSPGPNYVLSTGSRVYGLQPRPIRV